MIPENQLMIILQERQQQEEADILALDKEGKLYIFELKRWVSNRENILQVLRYGQKFGQYEYNDLEVLLRKYLHENSINLQNKHRDYFNDILNGKEIDKEKFNCDQAFVIITNGADIETLNSIKYWKTKGLRIECLPYRIYKYNNDYFLEFTSFNPENEVIINDEQGYFIVNTNLTWSDENYKKMLSENKAAGYGIPRYGIQRIKDKDMVFLYHNVVGIIAYGKAYGQTIKEEEKEEYYVKIKFDWKIDPDTEPDKGIKAYEINRRFNSRYSFRQTVFAIPEEMAKIIFSLKSEKINNT